MYHRSATIRPDQRPADYQLKRADVLQKHGPGNPQLNLRIAGHFVIAFKADAVLAQVLCAAGANKDTIPPSIREAELLGEFPALAAAASAWELGRCICGSEVCG
jgi:hypothetical protein